MIFKMTPVRYKSEAIIQPAVPAIAILAILLVKFLAVIAPPLEIPGTG